ncbi:MAG: hypothetical protein HY059_12205 [Proteobacteria bacterium]|nr:hypothetical protein [Pseudomonadota bacterium]
MTANAIQQFAIDHVAAEDRLLLRLNAASQPASVRLFITRRFLRMFWAALTGELRKAMADTKNPLAREFLLDMAETRATAKADFKTPFREPGAAAVPGGAAKPEVAAQGRLLFGFNVSRNAEGMNTIVLIATDNTRVELGLVDEGVFGLLKILRDAAQKAEWDLPMEWGRGGTAAVAVGEAVAARRLN